MEKKLIYKMIRQCFQQYEHEACEADYEKLYERIVEEQAQEEQVPLFELINDAVYEYLTN
ncbi:YqzH family protein [Robertmurraya korlensis]|uniref:YqzH family protein n=1 Tax=Robertmurraya korlensis TaxID=519977 RepID=UPI0020409B86|nr:YqzH family protein [Robertmurraya korlensis]MCM3599686.1 YqzH family protein [Robertmurraya korlensis]